MFCTYLYIIHEPVHFPRPKHSEHGLTNVERVPPIVVTDRPVILLDTENPSTEDFVRNVVLLYQTKLHKHSDSDLISVFIWQSHVIEFVAKKIQRNDKKKHCFQQ